MLRREKHILITGSTDGIGKLAAIKLAQEGHHIYIHGRSEAKLNNVIAEIKSLSNNPNIKGYVADFSDLKAVSTMAKQVKSEIEKLDVLINNAGIFHTPQETTKDGLDIRFAVNYFAPYILTKKLMPLLNNSIAERIINLSSAAQSTVSIDALKGNKQLSVNEAYAQSKLALTMWSFHLATLQKTPTVIAVNPGSLLNTKMANEAYGKHWSPADKGANILYDLALSNEYNSITGKYFDNDKGEEKGMFGPAHPDAYDKALIENLMIETESILSSL